jgi:hypothetical protein
LYSAKMRPYFSSFKHYIELLTMSKMYLFISRFVNGNSIYVSNFCRNDVTHLNLFKCKHKTWNVQEEWWNNELKIAIWACYLQSNLNMYNVHLSSNFGYENNCYVKVLVHVKRIPEICCCKTKNQDWNSHSTCNF